MNDILTVTGALLIVLSGAPYIVDIIKKKTRPNIVSWFTWELLILIGAFAALDAHEIRTAIITFADALQVGLILVLGLKYGYAKLTLFDVICQIGAIAGLVLWLIFNSPTIAIIATVTIDLIAALPTFRHSWQQPGEETWQTYFVGGIGAAFGIAALTSFTINSLAYPLYLFILGLSLAATIIISRRRKGIPFFR
jgi:hypothetical protein